MNKLFTFLCFIIIFALPFLSNAQKENNTWYFGKYAGITFNTADGNPVALSNSKMSVMEGTATVSDKNGNFLFYTDGMSVWDRTLDTMPNGTGLFGGSSSSNSALIIPNPTDTTIYYIFTANESETFSYKPDSLGKGISYSVVDMKLNNGNGDITQKNIQLFRPSCEKLATVKNMLNNTIWVVTHEWGTNAFKAFQVTDKGVNPLPVVSYSGKIHQGWPVVATGRLGISSDGLSLAVTLPFHIDKDSVKNQGDVELFDFNPNTGVVSNPRSLLVKAPTYGVAFSPDGTKLFVRITNEIHQYNLNFCTIEEIRNSKTIVANNTGEFFNAIERGPNGKIYVEFDGKDYLGVFNSPDKYGVSCNYIYKAVDLNKKTGLWGLPTFLQSYYTGQVKKTPTVALCEGETLRLNSDCIPSARKYHWSGPNGFFFDGPGMVIPAVKPVMSGLYKCVASFVDSTKDSLSYCVTVYPKPPVSIFPDSAKLNLCDVDSVVLRALPDAGNFQYKWSTDETSKEIIVKNTGNYSVVITSENGCSDSAVAKVTLKASGKIKILAPRGATLCRGDSIPLILNNDYLDYTWSTGEKTKMIFAKKTGWYYVNVIDSSKCQGIDSIKVDEINSGISFQPLDFGEVCLGMKSEIKGSLTNSNPNPITIDKFYFSQNSVFSATSGITLPATLKPGSVINYSVYFEPPFIGQYNENLSVTISQPCPNELKIPVTGRAVVPELYITIPDTSGLIGRTNFCIPVYGRLSCHSTSYTNLNLILDINYNAELFNVSNVTKGKIISKTIVGDKRKIRVEIDNVLLNDTLKILTKLCGRIYLADNDWTELKFDSIQTGINILTHITNGSLSGTGVCARDLRHIQRMNYATVKVTPNPTNDNEVEIIAENLDKNRYSISVYDITGRKVYSGIWDIENGGLNSFKMSTGNFAAGIHYIIIGSTSSIIKVPLIIF